MRVATVDSAATAIEPAVVDPTGMFCSAMAVGVLAFLCVGGCVCGVTGCGAAGQPTAPSICSSISRLSSSAYSIGSSLAIGSTKPRTIIAIASSSERPRLIR